MAEQLEQTLLNLLVPDNDVIQQATVELKRMLLDPAVIPALCQLLSASSKPEVRQYASVLLRRKILKANQWGAVPANICQDIRQNILQVLVKEPEKSVRKSLTQLIASVGKHDLPSNRWPELFQFVNLSIQNNDPAQREIGMSIVSALSAIAFEQLKPHMRPLLSLCSSALDDQQNHFVLHYAVLTMTNLIPAIGTDHLKPYQAIIPKVMNAIKTLISVDVEMAVESLEMLDELASCEVTILTPFVKQVIQFALEISGNKVLDNEIRMKALSFLITLTKQKKKAIVKMNLVQPILAAVFSILCDATAEEEADEDEDEEVAKTPSSVAAQVIDCMALNFPPEKFVSSLMKLVEPALSNQDQFHRRAAYLAIAVASEGCADCMRTKHLKKLLQSVYTGMADPSAEVRGAAMFALGQFSDYLQPDISKFSSELLPLLFACLAKTSHDCGMSRKDIIRTYYAVEMFCENLGRDILPYLGQLMPFLMNAVRSAPTEGKELAISAIGATASAAMEDFLPYFNDVIELLKTNLVPSEDDKLDKLRTQAVDTLGILARTLGEHFRPLANDCLTLGLNLLNSTEDPDLKRSAYGLFSAISTLLKQEMSPHLGTIVGCMLESLRSVEGLKANFKDSNMEHVLHLFDNSNEDDEEEIDISDEKDDFHTDVSEIKSVEVENSYSEEKEDALSSLAELASNTGSAFLPFIDEVYKEAFDLLDYPLGDVRKEAVLAVGQICLAVYKLAQDPCYPNCVAIASNMMSAIAPHLMEMLREDENREVVMAILDTLNNLLKEIKLPFLQAIGSATPIIGVIKDAFQEKLKCQGEEEEISEDDEQAESDSILVENGGDLLVTLAGLLGGEEFSPFFAGLLPDFLKKLKPSSSIPERSFGIGTIAEILDKIGNSTSRFVSPLYNVVMNIILDEDEEVRSNAIYCIGVLAANGGPAVFSRYSDILKKLVEILNRETYRRAIDNICAAVCRMIMAHSEAVPLDQVLPTVIRCLPLEEDKEETITVIQCLAVLYSNQQPTIISLLPQLIIILGQLLGTDISIEVRTIIVKWVKDMSTKCPEVLNGALSSSSEAISNSLKMCFMEG